MKLQDFPTNSRLILEQYLLPSTDNNASLSALSLNLYVQVARILCFNRTKIVVDPFTEDFPMIYGMLFSGSGTYKDAPQKALQYLCSKVEEDHELTKERRYNALYAVLVKRSEQEEGKAAQIEYRKTHAIRPWHEIYSGGTYQGLQADRLACQKYGIGSIHFKHGEIIDALKEKDSNTWTILSKIKDITLQGESLSDSIKSENIRSHVKDVPQTMMVHGSIAELFSIQNLHEKVIGMLATGFARRTFILFSKKTGRNILTSEEERENREKMLASQDKIKDIFFQLHDKTCPGAIFDPETKMDNYFYKKISIDDDTQEMIKAYKDHCYMKANTMHDERERADLYDRHYKAVRLASCIAMLEHPSNQKITIQDFDLAIKLCDEWGNEFMSFLLNHEDTDAEKMYKKLITSNDKVSKTELRNILPTSQRNKTPILNSCIEQLNEICVENNQILKTEKRRGLAEYYWIEALPDHESIEPTKELTVHLSVGDSNETTETHFVTKEIPFDQLHTIIGGERAYSASTFKDNTRKADNWAGVDDLLLFDIDNDGEELTTAEVKEKFKEFKYALFATRNHMKDKKDHGVKQRFRIVFPIPKLEGLTREEYAQLKTSIATEYGLLPHWDAGASKDCARLFFAHNGKYFYSDGSKLMNWKVFDYKIPEKKPYKPNPSTSIITSTKVAVNARPDQKFKTKQGHIVGWEHFEGLSKNEPVYCTEPQHKDDNPSAFISRNPTSGNLAFHCSGCSTSYFQR